MGSSREGGLPRHRRLGRVLINRDSAAIAGYRKRRVRVALDVQAIFCRRRHPPRRQPLAKIRPGSPAPAGRRLGPRHRSHGGAASDVAQVQVSQWRVTPQAAISRPNSFPSRPRAPSWTSRRTTRSGQSRPRRRFPLSMRAFASPLRRVELADRGSHIFSPPQREVVHKCAKFFGAPRKIGGDD